MQSQRNGEWLDFVADLMATPLTRWPHEQVARRLAETFDAVGCGFHARATDGSHVLRHWPPEFFAPHLDELAHWSIHHAPTEHPVLRYYLATGDDRCMQTADVPTAFADERVQARWAELAERWGGAQSQVALPLLVSPRRHKAFVLGRADPYTQQDMQLIHRLRRLLVGLDRQVSAFAGWSAQAAPAALDAAATARLTPRQLVVLDLLADGLTAASIGRRLNIAERTVQKHLQRGYAKLGVADRLAAVQRARIIGLLP